jgi:multimeric flavodoxin WrbA
MNVIAFNGSPRKGWNTATLLSHALEGAASQGAETELIHLYDYNYKGCRSCFACRLKNGKSYGKCAMKDELTPILEKVEDADALLFGSPIYIGNITGEMRSFMERLLYQYAVYDKFHTMLFKRKIPVGFIYTMNIPAVMLATEGYGLAFTEQAAERTFGGPLETLYVTDTYQFDDYSKYVCPLFDVEEKTRRREVQFPIDCRDAFEMGVRLTQQYHQP